MKRGIWLARDTDNSLWSHTTKPTRDVETGMFVSDHCQGYLQTTREKTRFPEVTWDNSPKFYRLIPEDD